jgi:Yip1-like protein
MNLVQRAKNMIVTPKTEWDVIAAESTPAGTLVTGYVLPLAAVAAIAGFIGMSIVGHSMFFLGGTYRVPIVAGLVTAVYQVVMAVVAVFVLSFIIDALAPTFGGTKDRAQALKVAVYSYTPAWVFGILAIIPALGMIAALASLYAIYLLYLGLPRLMRNPVEKSAGYTALVVVCAIVIAIVIAMIAGLITAPAMMATGSLGSGTVTYDKGSSGAKLDEFAKKMEEAGRRMEAAQKSGDASKQAEAAVAALGTAISGGKGVDPVQIDQLKPLVPATFAGLPKSSENAERGGVAGLMTAKVEASYADTAGAKNVQLEISDTGGAAGLMALAGWMNVQSERERNGRVERTRKEGNRMIHEESDKGTNESKYTVVLAERFVVSAEGNGVDLGTLKSAVASLDLGKLEAMK